MTRAGSWGALFLGLSCGCSQGRDDPTTCHPSETPGVQICEATPLPASSAQSAPGEDLNPRLLRRFAPLRANFQRGAAPPAALTELGRLLYFDKRLSSSGTVSCNSCHALDHYGTTDEARAKGANGKLERRNAPSTFNAAAQFSQFWDGRSPDVETQALVPLLDPDEMGMTSETTVAVLVGIQGYAAPFRAAFPEDSAPISLPHIGVALGAFERQLATPSRWDLYLKGDHSVLSAKEKEGLRVFTSVGCMVCHTGELVGGSMYERLGAAVPWPTGSDHGRAGVTHNSGDDLMFKVPSLRNVAQTAPYFHDGSIQTLDHAVRMMGAFQLGVDLTAPEVDAIVAWLGCLTGDVPANLVRKPVLPDERPL